MACAKCQLFTLCAVVHGSLCGTFTVNLHEYEGITLKKEAENAIQTPQERPLLDISAITMTRTVGLKSPIPDPQPLIPLFPLSLCACD